MPYQYDNPSPISAPGIDSIAASRCVSLSPGTLKPETITPNTTAPAIAASSAPTIPPQKLSGSQIVKCQMAIAIITQTSMLIGRASGACGSGAATAAGARGA